MGREREEGRRLDGKEGREGRRARAEGLTEDAKEGKERQRERTGVRAQRAHTHSLLLLLSPSLLFPLLSFFTPLPPYSGTVSLPGGLSFPSPPTHDSTAIHSLAPCVRFLLASLPPSLPPFCRASSSPSLVLLPHTLLSARALSMQKGKKRGERSLSKRGLFFSSPSFLLSNDGPLLLLSSSPFPFLTPFLLFSC